MRESLPLVLASGSPRRAELLGELGLPFRVIVSGDAEETDPALAPREQALQLAVRKARAVATTLPDGLIMGADTVVAIDRELLGKPRDDADAMRMLRLLSWSDHRVITGVALINAATGDCVSRSVATTVRFRHLSAEEIATYVTTGEPADKAGGYAIQGAGARLIEGLVGCFNNVVGLPLCEVTVLLTCAGVELPARWHGCRMPDGSLCPNSV